MMNHFYSDLVKLEKIIEVLETFDLSLEEKEELLHIAHETTHHAILDMILSELPEEDKTTFLIYISDEDHEMVWSHLRDNIEDIENKIIAVSKKVEETLLDDIKEIIE